MTRRCPIVEDAYSGGWRIAQLEEPLGVGALDGGVAKEKAPPVRLEHAPPGLGRGNDGAVVVEGEMAAEALVAVVRLGRAHKEPRARGFADFFVGQLRGQREPRHRGKRQDLAEPFLESPRPDASDRRSRRHTEIQGNSPSSTSRATRSRVKTRPPATSRAGADRASRSFSRRRLRGDHVGAASGRRRTSSQQLPRRPVVPGERPTALRKARAGACTGPWRTPWAGAVSWCIAESR